MICRSGAAISEPSPAIKADEAAQSPEKAGLLGVIRHNGPWRSIEEVEFATLEWVDWFNHRRLLEPIGNVPPVEFETMYFQNQEAPAKEAGLT